VLGPSLKCDGLAKKKPRHTAHNWSVDLMLGSDQAADQYGLLLPSSGLGEFLRTNEPSGIAMKL
jgi:hypothetical protein